MGSKQHIPDDPEQYEPFSDVNSNNEILVEDQHNPNLSTQPQPHPSQNPKPYHSLTEQKSL